MSKLATAEVILGALGFYGAMSVAGVRKATGDDQTTWLGIAAIALMLIAIGIGRLVDLQAWPGWPS